MHSKSLVVFCFLFYYYDYFPTLTLHFNIGRVTRHDLQSIDTLHGPVFMIFFRFVFDLTTVQSGRSDFYLADYSGKVRFGLVRPHIPVQIHKTQTDNMNPCIVAVHKRYEFLRFNLQRYIEKECNFTVYFTYIFMKLSTFFF